MDNFSKYKDLTIVIVTFYSENIIYKCIESIGKNIKIIIVENSNNLELKKDIEKKYSNVEVILSGNNLGYGKANNLGIKHSQTNFVLILNPDTLIDSTGNILLFGGVKVQVYNDDNIETNNIFSNRAVVYSKSDSMSAYCNVKVVSNINGYGILAVSFSLGFGIVSINVFWALVISVTKPLSNPPGAVTVLCFNNSCLAVSCVTAGSSSSSASSSPAFSSSLGVVASFC